MILVFALQPQNDIYEAQCIRYQLQLDRSRYAEGWRDGNYEFQLRQTNSVD